MNKLLENIKENNERCSINEWYLNDFSFVSKEVSKEMKTNIDSEFKKSVKESLKSSFLEDVMWIFQSFLYGQQGAFN